MMIKNKVNKLNKIDVAIISSYIIFIFSEFLKVYSLKRMTTFQNTIGVFIFSLGIFLYTFKYYKLIKVSKANFLIIAFSIWVALLGLVNQNIDIKSYIIFLTTVVFSFYVSNLFKNEIQIYFFVCFAFVNIPLILLGIYTFITKNSIYSGVSLYNPNRLQIFGHPNSTAAILSLCFFIVILVIYYLKNKNITVLLSFLLVLIFITISFTKSRTVNIALSIAIAVAVMLLYLFQNEKATLIKAIGLMIISCMAVFFTLLLSVELFDGIIDNDIEVSTMKIENTSISDNIINTSTSTTKDEEILIGGRTLSDIISFNGRTEIWEDAVSIITPEILLKGYSLDLNLTSQKIGHEIGPHNIFLALLLCTGIPGLLIFLLFIVDILFRGIFVIIKIKKFDAVIYLVMIIFIIICETMENAIYLLGFVSLMFFTVSGIICKNSKDYSFKLLYSQLKNIMKGSS